MAWVVDTCVLVDVAIDDPDFGRSSASYLQSRLRHGLLVSPVTFVEVGPVFSGDLETQKRFLDEAGINWLEPWTSSDTEEANRLWSLFVLRRRQQKLRKRPVAEVLIAAFASRFDGLITRNPSDFHDLSPELKLAQPG